MMTRWTLVSAALTVAAAAAWVVAITSIDMRAVGPLGFVTAAGTAYWVAWALLVLAMCSNLFSGRPWRALLPVHTLAVILILHATVPIAEAVPRFSTGWLHVGFTDHLMQTGETLPYLDARFSWPGFFSAAAALTTAAGLDSPLVLLRWAPVFLNVAYALLVYAIATQASDDQRLRWVAVWIFLVGNWVGQDYFSPQGTAVVLFLAVILIVLAAFRGRPAPMSLLSRTLPSELRTPVWAEGLFRRQWTVVFGDQEHESGTQLRPTVRTTLILLLVLLYGVLVVTHQLTPVALATCTGALVVAGRCRLSVLPVLMGAMFFGWLSFGAEVYWAGHLSDIFGDIGAIGSSVTENIGTRIGGSDARLTVLAVRLGFTGAICALAVVGFLRRSTRPRDRSFVLLAGAPFIVLAGNAYGGEALMRAFFYALPFIALYAAAALISPPATEPVTEPDHPVNRKLPARPWPAAVAPVLVAIVLLAAVAPFIVARYGNESFEMVTSEEKALFDAFYALAPTDADLVALSTEIPARYREVESHSLVSLDQSEEFLAARVDHLEGAARADALSAVFADAVMAHLEGAPDSLVVVSRGQDAFGQLTWSLPPGWTATFVDDLVATGRLAVVYENRDGWVLHSTGRFTPPTAPSLAGASGVTTTLPETIGAAVATLFVLSLPGAALITVLLLSGAGVRRARAMELRLSPVVLGALVIPLSLSALIATAQLMLWLRIWRPTEAMVLLGGLSVAILWAAAVRLTRQDGTAGADDVDDGEDAGSAHGTNGAGRTGGPDDADITDVRHVVPNGDRGRNGRPRERASAGVSGKPRS